jgi:hypothetical protein
VEFKSEQVIFRLRPKASKMFLPSLVLFAVSFGLVFSSDMVLPFDFEIALIAGAIVVFLFWLIPLLSYLFSFLELTDSKISYRFGLLGFRKRQLQLAEVSLIELQKAGSFGSKQILISSSEGGQLLIRGYARGKYLAAEIESLVKSFS